MFCEPYLHPACSFDKPSHLFLLISKVGQWDRISFFFSFRTGRYFLFSLELGLSVCLAKIFYVLTWTLCVPFFQPGSHVDLLCFIALFLVKTRLTTRIIWSWGQELNFFKLHKGSIQNGTELLTACFRCKKVVNGRMMYDMYY